MPLLDISPLCPCTTLEAPGIYSPALPSYLALVYQQGQELPPPDDVRANGGSSYEAAAVTG